MTDFVKKAVSLDQDSIGGYIKRIREKKNLKLSEVSEDININIKYLQAIESGNYRELPKGAYGKIFFKKYIEYLGVRHKNIVNEFVKEQNRNQNFESNIFFNQVVSWKHLLSLPKVLRNLLILLVVIICFIYLSIYFKNIFAAPFLELSVPQDNQIISDYNIVVEGRTEPESELKINGNLVLIDGSGYFSEGIHLKSGVNVVAVSSKKKYSREKEVIRQILVESRDAK